MLYTGVHTFLFSNVLLLTLVAVVVMRQIDSENYRPYSPKMYITWAFYLHTNLHDYQVRILVTLLKVSSDGAFYALRLLHNREFFGSKLDF